MTQPKIDFNDRMLSLGLARVSEAAAIASADLIGRGDEKAADQAAVNAMREQLNKLDIAGVVVIGEGERDEAPMLYIGEEVGTGTGPGVDIALDPLEGTTLTAKDMPNALTVIAMGPRGIHVARARRVYGKTGNRTWICRWHGDIGYDTRRTRDRIGRSQRMRCA
jgi:fructose-1,6-bisphosphatase II / sedoheptulose-1,7-bisphosphatase